MASPAQDQIGVLAMDRALDRLEGLDGSLAGIVEDCA